jgi:hypothetical protein
MATRIARVTLTIKLTDGKDDDLIQWIASIPTGRRQAVVKHLLREALENQDPTTAQRLEQVGQDVAWLRAALSEMPTWMEGLLARVAVVNSGETPTAKPKTEHGDQLSTEGVTRREKRIAKTTW